MAIMPQIMGVPSGGGYTNIHYEPIKSQPSGSFTLDFEPKKIYTFSYYGSYTDKCRGCVWDAKVSLTDVSVYINGSYSSTIQVGDVANSANIMSVNGTSITIETGGAQNCMGFVAIG